MTRLNASREEAGFTLTELMVVMLLGVILVTLGAFAVRKYWLRRSLEGAQDQVVSQLRQVQQRSMAETYPIVYGVRFEKDTSRWGVVRYNASTATCQAVNNLTMSDGVIFLGSGTDFPDVVTPSTMSTACRNAAPGASGNHEVIFFYPKGSTNAATAGSTLTLRQPALPQDDTVTVSKLTGKVTRG